MKTDKRIEDEIAAASASRMDSVIAEVVDKHMARLADGVTVASSNLPTVIVDGQSPPSRPPQLKGEIIDEPQNDQRQPENEIEKQGEPIMPGQNNGQIPAWMHLQTEPLSQKELSRWFGRSIRRIRETLEELDGAVEVRGGWKIPLHQMPAAYLIDAGLMDDPKKQSAKTGQPPI